MSSCPGTVTDSTTHAKLSGMCVYLSAGSSGPGNPTATTASNGTYSIESVPPASYTVTINDGEYGCGNQSKYGYLSSTAHITVSAGHSNTVNSALVAGGAIGGTVTSQKTGAVLPGICVIVTGGFRGAVYTITDNKGRYLVGSLPDTYSVTFSTVEPGGAHPGCGTTGVYADKTYAKVVVTSDATTTLSTALAP